jgi:predicted Zn-dependent protease
MDKEKALKEIQFNISKKNTRLASEQTKELANCFSEDPFTLLMCSSLMKVIGDEKGAEEIARSIPDKVKEGNELEVAKGLRGLWYPAEAEKLLYRIEENDEVIRERMRVFFDMMRYGEVQSLYERLSVPTLEDSAVMIDALSSNKEFDRAVWLAEDLLEEAPDNLILQRCYCGALTAAGRTKEAEGYVRGILKMNKSSPNANALASYYLWIVGKTTGAGSLASKAIKADPSNTMAMEILAYCMIEKRKPQEAKIIAGAINEKEPGNPAVVRILDMCRMAER